MREQVLHSGNGLLTIRQKWEEFEDKYFHELSEKPEVIDQLAGLAREHPVITFLFAAKDEEHNNAVALKQYLDMRGMG